MNKFKALRAKYQQNIVTEAKPVSQFYATALKEGMDFWRVTVTKSMNKLKKGQNVIVKARNAAEALKKGAKNLGDPLVNQSGYLDAVKDKKESTLSTFAKIQEKGKYTNIWNKVKGLKGVSNAEKDMISNMEPSRLGDVVKALAPMFEVNEAKGPKLKVIVGKFKNDIAKFQKGGDLDYKAENALLSWALEYTTDIKTDDADEMDSWLIDNIKDAKAFAKLQKEYK